MSRPAHSIFFVLAAVLVCAEIAPADTAGLLVHGSSDVSWIARREATDPSEPLTIVQSRRVGEATPWKPIGLLKARVICLSNLGGRLATLLENGDWMLLWDGGSSSGAQPEDGAKLLQLATDGRTLYAIGAAGRGRAPTTRAATQPASSLPVDTLSLYRLDGVQWTYVTRLPPDLADSTALALGFADQQVLLAALTPAGAVEIRSLESTGHTWHAITRFPSPPGTARLKFLPGLTGPALWVAGPDGAGAIAFGNAGWSSLTPLTVPADAPTGLTDIAVAGERSIRLVIAPVRKGKLLELSYDDTGASRGKLEIPALMPPSSESQPAEWIKTISAVLLLMVFWQAMRRRTIIQPESLESAGIMLAPLGRRLLAAVIDAAPLFVTVAIVVARMDIDDHTDLESVAPKVYLPYYIASAIYILHTMLTEWLWGWTVGKLCCGLRTVMLDGRPLTARAAVIRNILRIVDVAMILPPLLVLLSPLRQRVGDVAGETIVVLASSAKADADPDSTKP